MDRTEDGRGDVVTPGQGEVVTPGRGALCTYNDAADPQNIKDLRGAVARSTSRLAMALNSSAKKSKRTVVRCLTRQARLSNTTHASPISKLDGGTGC
jgi:hypothetical protein